MYFCLLGMLFALFMGNVTGASVLLFLSGALVGVELLLLHFQKPNAERVAYMLATAWRYVGDKETRGLSNKPRWYVLSVEGSQVTVDTKGNLVSPPVTIPYSLFCELFEEYDKP
jgi:hypothetical protein